MGREAVVEARWGGGAGEVKALLESTELILRGAVRRRWSCAVLRTVRVDGEWLCFEALSEEVALRLGAEQAAKWAAVLAKTPPTLAEKLGLIGPVRACFAGVADDPLLAEALEGHDALEAEADMLILRTDSAADLETALEHHAALAARAPVWVVHGKGPRASFGEAAVRTLMRARGFMDNKVSAVSDRLSATRYAVKRG